MGYRLAVIGPHDLVERTLPLAERFPLLNLLPLPYDTESATLDMVEQALAEKAQAFLFTGFLPYYLATTGGLSHPAFYYPIADNSLVPLLFHLKVHHGIDVEALSLDTLRREEIVRVYRELDLSSDKLFVNSHGLTEFNLEQYVDFHRSLYLAGQTVGGITAVNSVYQILREQNVAIFRVVPNQVTMERTLLLATTFADGEMAKESQLIFQLISTDLDEVGDKSKRAGLKERLEDYARKQQGALMVTDQQEFIVLINQRVFKKYSNFYESIPFLDAIQNGLGIKLYMGIGMGHTARQALEHSRGALKLARTRSESNAFIIQDEKVVIGPIHFRNERPEVYQLSSSDAALCELSQKTQLSVSTLTKLQHVLEDMDRDSITSKIISDSLKVSLRTANRILSKLAAAGVAVEVGVEDAIGRGRPRRIYWVNL